MNAGLDIRKFVAFLACLAGLCSVPGFAAEPAKASKFDLVYLVGVDEAELKPGVKAFVEPMFFTDGKELVFVYDYCRRDYARIHKGKPPARYIGKRGLADHEMLAEDRAAMRLYCDNRGFSLKGEAYHTRSSLGTRILLDDIAFEGTGEHHPQLRSPEMPQPGLAKISTVEGPSFQIAGSDKFWGPKHYFLASRNSALLADLMPVPRTDEKQIQQFVARAKAYGGSQKGMVIWACLERDPNKGFCKWGNQAYSSDRSKGKFHASELGIGPMLLADIDGDGLLDAMVGLRALQKQRSNVRGQEEPDILTWSATAFLLGNGKSFHFAELDLNRVAPTEFLYYMPLAFLRVGDCRYVLINSDDVEMELLFLAQPHESKACPNRATYKRLQAE